MGKKIVPTLNTHKRSPKAEGSVDLWDNQLLQAGNSSEQWEFLSHNSVQSPRLIQI